ncbi:helix-turn-helix domain-containing protein [Rhizobium laguerreae]|uniref:YdaS family helix-turn-helix protein n=1 Tax=Rhizobium laguerreae TaxID=1076926 RepID=UPI001C91A45F|nr:YdaS family helix-turn-helix protein [Rhizobium laguerreae]MBY3162089.1 helix-turn-helix domain-containing protein [Rhizobium laguerreae]
MVETKTGMEAVRAVTSLAALASKIGVTRGAISQWEKVPEERLDAVSDATGIPKHVLRPELYDGYVPVEAA